LSYCYWFWFASCAL